MSKTLKILHLGKYFLPFAGGIENFMAGLIAEQLRQGHKVAAIVHQHRPGAPGERRDFHGAEIHVLRSIGTLPLVPLAPGFPARLRAVIREFRPDVIHIHMPNVAPFWALFMPAAKRIPWVVHWHSDVLDNDSPRFIRWLYPFYRRFERALLRRSRVIIATSPNYARSSVPLRDFRSRVKVVPLGIKPPPYRRELPPGRGDTLKLVCVGRFSYYKGYKHLLDAFAGTLAKGAEMRLEIIGDGDLRAALCAQIRRLGLDEKITLPGSLGNEERDRRILSADLLCLPSVERTEAFGLVLLEAMSLATPCLVGDVPGSGMSWVVEDGKTGFVYPAGDTRALVSLLNEVAAQRASLPALGEAGLERFRRHFTIEVVSRQILAIYQGLLATEKIAENG